MKRHQLLDHLRRHGCILVQEGARHSIYRNPAKESQAPGPRHSEIDNRLALMICRELSVPPLPK